MKSIDKVINKLKWDHRENPENYFIYYWDRVEKEYFEMKLAYYIFSDFNVIPMHRIKYIEKQIKVDGQFERRVVWDRNKKIDKI